MENFLNNINSILTKKDLREYSPLTLAFIGDSVFDICVKTYILRQTSNKNLHNNVKNYVNANKQSQMYKFLIENATEEEIAILKRGRNAKTNSIPKNSSKIDYKNATGLEALFGYLYLKGDMERILEVFKMCLED